MRKSTFSTPNLLAHPYSFARAIVFTLLLCNIPFVYGNELPADIVTIDTDGDGVYDLMDIDDDGDGILDVVEDDNSDGDNNPATNPTDTDSDGVPNYLDLDSDNDGILDNVEAQFAYVAPLNKDENGNGLDDIYEIGNGLNPIDSDGDSVADFIDLDSDGDGLLDSSESSVLSTDFDCETVPNLNFVNGPTLESGNLFDEGSVYRFADIADGLDALVTIEKVVNGEISTLDQNSVDPEFFKPEIFFSVEGENRNPYVDLRITLVSAGTDNSAVLDELITNFLDVDGNETYQEFNRFDTPVSYTFDQPKDITIENTGGGLLINGGTTEYSGISNVNPQVNVGVEFVDISTFVFRFGIIATGTDNFRTNVARQSGIQFACLNNFNNPQTVIFNTDVDSDGDGYPNRVDIDSDNDGIPDNVEGQTTDGYVAPSGEDTDNDGLDDSYEGSGNAGLTPVNTDGSDEPDYTDLDSDNDSVPDNNEGNDFNFDGVPDQAFTGTDTDGDGLDDGYEGGDVDDGFDVNDEIDDPANDLPDTDGTEDVNYRDLDDDGDGTPTAEEDPNGNGDPTDDDSDNDGTPDYLDPDSPMLDVIDDSASTPSNTAVDIDILGNDLGIPSDGTITFTEPLDGIIEINDAGTLEDLTDDFVTYTPNIDFNGTDGFEYTICNVVGNCDTATVIILVGTPPMLDVVNDSGVTDPETAVDIDILLNDINLPNDGNVTFTGASNGIVLANDGGTPDELLDDFVTYTPNAGFSGTDIFEYTVCDLLDNCDTAIVNIVVNEPQIVAIEVNQIVSPNSDGKNDFLFIRGVENIRNSTLKIFNRWGVAVYEGENYNNQNNVFDGRSRGRSTLSVEDYLPPGVYYYIFDYTTLTGETIVDSEYIYISRK